MFQSIRTLVAASAMAALLSGCQLFMQPPERSEAAVRSVLHDAALSSKQAHNYYAAVTYYGTLYRRDPADLAAALGFARNLRVIGNGEQAVAVLHDAIARTPEEARLYAELGKAQVAAGRPEEAVAAFALAEAHGLQDWSMQSARGIAHDMLGEHGAAEASYRAALALAPDRPSVLNNLGLSLALAGRLDDSIAVLERLATAPGATAHARQNLALLYALRGDIDKAEPLAARHLPVADATANIAYLRQLAQRPAGR